MTSADATMDGEFRYVHLSVLAQLAARRNRVIGKAGKPSLEGPNHLKTLQI
jgi:hypothetical protein